MNDFRTIRRLRNVISAALALVGALALTDAQAGTATQTFQVSATVVNECTIATSALSFGTYSSIRTAATTGTGTLSVTCTNGDAYTIALNPGTATGATVTTRKMLNGTNTLAYSLFRDSARTLNWGQTTGTDTYAGTGTGSTQTVTVYGSIPTGQTAPVSATAYTDTITATISF